MRFIKTATVSVVKQKTSRNNKGEHTNVMYAPLYSIFILKDKLK